MPEAFARLDDGTEHDITEAVAALYDLVTNSVDWGSGFISVEDALPIARVCKLMGYETCPEVVKYVREQAELEQADAEAQQLRAEIEALSPTDIQKAGAIIWGKTPTAWEADRYLSAEELRRSHVLRVRTRAAIDSLKSIRGTP